MRDALYNSAWGPLSVGLAVGCLVLVATVVALSRPRAAWLRSRIGAYDGGEQTAGFEPGRMRPRVDDLLQATERRLDGSSLSRRLERLLQRAAVEARASEVLYLSLGFGVAACALAHVLVSSVIASLAFGLLAFCAPVAVLHLKGRRRLRRFDDQLPDVLMTMSSSLAVGHSFNQAVQAIVAEGQSPACDEFGRLLGESKLGRPMDEALAAMSERVGSKELAFVLMSVRIQRQIGGSLAGLFATVSQTVRERQQFQRKVRALTAMGRASATVLVALPFCAGGLIAVLNPSYLAPLFTESTGRIMVASGLVMMVLGGFILKRIVSFKG
jgi:tight adherence protein B